jgi:hypothetical protein
MQLCFRSHRGTATDGMTMTTGKSFDYQQALDDPCRIFGVIAQPTPSAGSD